MLAKQEYEGYVPGHSIRGISPKAVEEYRSEIEKCRKRGTDVTFLEKLLEQILSIYKEIETQKEENLRHQKNRAGARYTHEG